MNPSLKVRLVFWTVYGACFLMLSAFSQWALGFSMLTPLSPELRAFNKDGSTAGGVFLSFHFLFSIYTPCYIAGGMCRAWGLSLERREQSPVAPSVQGTETVAESAELRSYATKTIFQVNFWIYLGLSVLTLFFGLFLAAPSTSSVAVWPAFLMALTLADVFGLASKAKWRGKFVAVADAEGVESLAVGNTRLRVRARWAEIKKAIRVDSFNLFGTLVSSQIEFQEGNGKTRLQVPLSHAPQPQQEQFTRVVARYLPAHSES